MRFPRDRDCRNSSPVAFVIVCFLLLASCDPAKKPAHDIISTKRETSAASTRDDGIGEQPVFVANSLDYKSAYVVPDGLPDDLREVFDAKIEGFELRRKELQDELFLASTNEELLRKLAKEYGKPVRETRKAVQNAYNPDQNDELIEMDFGGIVYTLYHAKGEHERTFIVSVIVSRLPGKKLINSILTMKRADLESLFGKTVNDKPDSMYLSSLNPEYFDDEVRVVFKGDSAEKIVYVASI